ncbi:MAG: NifU family protein [Saprospiraceae bacterium]|nr:NifU family protein [Saprospiraceae bacterium]MBK8634326.1 NifU family protein [Saprospiraceae bacterium]MBP7644469.1 NifU family protein [Saprospiraceae bacterium]
MTETEKDLLFEKVNKALDDIRPHLAVDEGNIEIVDITQDMHVKVKWLGNCEFCSMSAMTMRAGVEQAIRSRVPEIVSIEAVNGLN